MTGTKRTILVVGATTGVGFIGNVLSYSVKVPSAQQSKFRFEIPKGRELAFVLLTGVVAGLVINKALGFIEDSFKSVEEKNLDTLVDNEKQKIRQGIIVNKNPIEVVWS